MITLHLNKYTDEAKRLIGSKTKAEDWLHIAVQYNTENDHFAYAIYVWDTRKVLETGSDNRSYIGGALQFSSKIVGSKSVPMNIPFAFDTTKPLITDSYDIIADNINTMLADMKEGEYFSISK